MSAPSSPFNIAGQQAPLLAPVLVSMYVGTAVFIVPRLAPYSSTHLIPYWQALFQTIGLGDVSRGRLPIALLVAATFQTWVVTAILSVVGAAYAQDGYVNKEPRSYKRNLRGFPARLTAAHEAILEFYPAFAVAAVLVQTLDHGIVGGSAILINELALVASVK